MPQLVSQAPLEAKSGDVRLGVGIQLGRPVLLPLFTEGISVGTFRRQEPWNPLSCRVTVSRRTDQAPSPIGTTKLQMIDRADNRGKPRRSCRCHLANHFLRSVDLRTIRPDGEIQHLP